MANGESYTEVLAGIRDRLGGIDDRLTSVEDRITQSAASDRADAIATRGDIEALRKVVNEEQALQNTRIGVVENYTAIRSSIERCLIWGIGISVSIAGVVCGLLKLVLR